LEALDALVEPESRGDPMCRLRWTTKSTRRLADEHRAQGSVVSHVTVGELLHAMGYSLQANAKENEGTQNPDRDAQFRHIADEVTVHLGKGDPVISVDCKRKGTTGNLKNVGTIGAILPSSGAPECYFSTILANLRKAEASGPRSR